MSLEARKPRRVALFHQQVLAGGPYAPQDLGVVATALLAPAYPWLVLRLPLARRSSRPAPWVELCPAAGSPHRQPERQRRIEDVGQTDAVFEGSSEEVVDGDGLPIFVRHRLVPERPVVLLLHGHPRTSATWYRVAPLLVDAGLSVVCADLPGYGRSGKPEPAADHRPHAKTVWARQLRAAMHGLGQDRFAVVGHDRGSYGAFRLALDHPEVVTRVALLDGIPVVEHLERCDVAFATAWWHWFFFAQPDKPERAIGADPQAWYGFDERRLGAENAAECRAAVADPAVVRGMLEDYRAGLTVDADDERAARAAGLRVRQPLLVLWSLRDDLEELHGDPRVIWRDWADDVSGHGIDSGHHVAEEAPEALAAALVPFLLG